MDDKERVPEPNAQSGASRVTKHVTRSVMLDPTAPFGLRAAACSTSRYV